MWNVGDPFAFVKFNTKAFSIVCLFVCLFCIASSVRFLYSIRYFDVTFNNIYESFTWSITSAVVQHVS